MRAIIIGGGPVAMIHRADLLAVTSPAPVGEASESWGRGERFGYAPLPDGRVYCFATANAQEGAPGGGLAGLRARFGGRHFRAG